MRPQTGGQPGEGPGHALLDTVIRTMKSTYKETSLGGLAVNVVGC